MPQERTGYSRNPDFESLATDKAGINRAVGDAPLEILGNGDSVAGIELHTLDDAGTTQENRSSIRWRDDAGNPVGQIVAHSTGASSSHVSLYAVDGNGNQFKVWNAESNGNFNFSSDVQRVNLESDLYITNDELTGLTLERTDADSQRIQFLNSVGDSVEIRQAGDQLRIIGNDGNMIAQAVTGGPFRIRNGPLDLFDNPAIGLREVGAQPTASDLNSQEFAFTKDRDGAGQASWLFKDSTGAAHFMDVDGTL